MEAARKNGGDPERLQEIHVLYKKMMVEHWEVFANDLGPRRDRFIRAWPGRNQEQMWQVVWDLFCGVHEIERFVKICREYAMQETDDEYAKRTAKGEMHWSHPMWKPPSERRRNAIAFVPGGDGEAPPSTARSDSTASVDELAVVLLTATTPGRRLALMPTSRANNLNAPAHGSFLGAAASSLPEGGGCDRSASASAALPRASQAKIAADSRALWVTMGSPRPSAVRSGNSISAKPNRSKASDVYNVAEAPRLSNSSSPKFSSQHSNNFSMHTSIDAPQRSTCSLAIDERSTSMTGPLGRRRPQAAGAPTTMDGSSVVAAAMADVKSSDGAAFSVTLTQTSPSTGSDGLASSDTSS